MGIDHSVDPNLKPARARPLLAHKPHGVPTKKGAAVNFQLPLAPKFGPAGASGGDVASRQRFLAGNSLNDEQRSDDLSNRLSH